MNKGILTRYIAALSLLLFSLSCQRSSRIITEYHQSKTAESGQPLNDESFINALGQARYDEWVEAVGRDTLDNLVYGAGQSNVISLVNEIADADKLATLLSGTNKLSPTDVLNLLNYTDRNVQYENPPYTDVIVKVGGLIRDVNDMQLVKDLVQYIEDNASDPGGSAWAGSYNSLQRLSLVIALVNENTGTMPAILNAVTTFDNGSPPVANRGRDNLIRVLNETNDLRRLTAVINDTTVVSNVSVLITNLDSDGKKPGQAGNVADGVEAMARILNESSGTAKLATMINNVSVLSNLYGVLNSVTNDGKKPGDSGNNADGVDALVATLNNVNDINRLTWLVNNLDQNPSTNNDEDFEHGSCASNTFDNNQNIAYSDNRLNSVPSVWNGYSWRISEDNQFGSTSCSLRNYNNLATSDSNFKQTVESVVLTANVSTSGNFSFALKYSLGGSDTVKFYINDVLKKTYTAGSATYAVNNAATTFAVSTGVQKFRWEVSRINGNNGTNRAWIDNIQVPGNAGSGKLPYEKVAILLNELYIDSINNVAQIMNASSAPCSAPITSSCTSSLTNGLSALLNIINKVEYPASNSETPNMVSIVNQLTGVSTLTDLLNGLETGGAKQLVHTVNFASNGDDLRDLINNLESGGGNKVVDILNSLDSAGGYNIVELFDETSVSNLVTLINGATTTSHMATIISTLDLNGQVINSINSNSSPTGAAKLAQLISKVEAKANISIAVHMVRLINDISASGESGAKIVGRIVGGLDLQASGVNGLDRMVEVMYQLRATSSVTYTNALTSGGSDDFGRLTTLINDMGDDGWFNTVRLVNETDCPSLSSGCKLSFVTGLVKNTNRIRYLARMVTEMTSVELVLSLFTNSSDMTRVQSMVNNLGDLAYPGGSELPSTSYYAYGQTAANAGLSTNTSDELGRMIVLINEISGGTAISNVISLINDSYNITPVESLVKDSTRVRYLTDIINKITNIQLMLTIINGPSGNGSDGASISKLTTFVNNVGGSTRKGTGSKSVGDMTIIANVINELGVESNGTTLRSASDQARIVTLLNNVDYCGLKTSVDKTVTYGYSSDFLSCDSTVTYNYNKNSDSYDRRHRLSNFILGMNDSRPVAIIVGDVTDTNKTVRILNGARRINTIIKVVDWLPGEVTAKLVNNADLNAMYRSFIYLVNNLESDEDQAALAFASMIHWGTGIGDGTNRTGTCHYFTGIGPGRLAQVLNIDTGETLKGIIDDFGWRTAIPAMVCGFGTPYKGEPQNISRSYPNNPMPSASSQNFYRSESVSVNDTRFSRGTYTHYYHAPWWKQEVKPNWWNSYSWDHTGENESYKSEACKAFLPEGTGVWPNYTDTDKLVWESGYTYVFSIVDPGVSSVWDVLRGTGVIAWLLDNAGTMGLPPSNKKDVSNCRLDPATQPSIQYTRTGGGLSGSIRAGQKAITRNGGSQNGGANYGKKADLHQSGYY